MKLTKGQKLDSGFTVIDVVELAELRATGIWVKHDKCGTEVFHILNDDSENLFAFTFTTIPEDNTGLAHILEHSVLCGSKNYPLKDAFLVLAQGSLQTFLNAWTFPDKTVYPASSVNEHDYFNLMSVYGDAVFRPLLSEWTFMQEGCRYEFTPEGKLSITGVVYNEMKGAYSSLETFANHWSVKAVLPDTPYSFESGGDPEYIPDLNREKLEEFHRRRYSPANCRVFLAGNIPTEKQLSFLNDRFLSLMDGGNASPPVTKQKKWAEPKEINVPCPAGTETKATAFLSWLCSGCGTAGNSASNENIALAALTEILLGHDGSPLTRTLIESGIGEDITPVSGVEYEIGETLFVAGLRGLKDSPAENAGKQLETLILEELQRLVNEGIPRGEIDAALSYMEFSQREVKRSGGPFSLVWMRRSLQAWLHGGKPWDSLLMIPALNAIKQNLTENEHYFESLIKKYLLDNPHRALVIVEPKDDFLPRQQAKLAQTLSKTEQAMSETEKQAVKNKSEALEKIQSEDDSADALAAIPHLSRSDLSPEPEIISRNLEDLKGIPALCHELYTNGISYTDFAFPLDILPPEDYPWIPFFARAIVSVGLPGMDYGEVSSLLARTVGGFSAILHTGSAAVPAGSEDTGFIIQTPSGKLELAGRDWIIYRLKCLDEKTEPSLDIALRLIGEADFSDTRRIKDLVLEMKNDINSSLAPGGHNFASCRASRFSSVANQTGEIWNGITQLEFVNRLAEMDINETAAKLRYLRDAIAAGGVIANFAGSSQAIKTTGSLFTDRFGRFGHPKPSLSPCSILQSQPSSAEVFASPSLQIGFAAMSMRAAPYDTIEQAAESVLAHQLSTGALWETIRMKGGAYGAFASGDSLEQCFSLATYRDPGPLRSLEAFSSILKIKADTEEDDLVKTIIGCYARETRPRSPTEKTLFDFLRFLSRIDDGFRRRKLERLITLTPGDLDAALDSLSKQEIRCRVIIAGMKEADSAAKALGAQLRVLPV